MKYQKVFSLLFFTIFTISNFGMADVITETSSDTIQIDVVDPNIQSTEMFSTSAAPPASFKTIQLESKNSHSISDLIKTDSSISESYSAIGYSDSIAIRGIPLNSQNNFFRDGLPFLTEAPVHLENKSRVEMIKGTYGILGGLSSPGGLINYVTTKPSAEQKTIFKTELTQTGQVGVVAETHRAFDTENNHLSHFVLSGTKLNPNLKNTEGYKYLGAFTLDSKIDTNLEIHSNIEFSHQAQPSQPGFSLLGSALPTEIEPDKNLNQQLWTLPVEFNNLIGSVQIKIILSKNTQFRFSALAQNILTNDRLAFPYGCTSEGNFDRYCSDGTFDLYDYRSENEKRTNQVYKISLDHQILFNQIKNKSSLSFQNRIVTERYNKQAYNYVGIGNIDNSIQVNPDESLASENTNKDSKYNGLTFLNSTEIDQFNLDLGLKYDQINKTTVRTDSTQETAVVQNFVLPWTALSYRVSNYLTYISYSEGLESYVTPNKPSYNFPGQNLPDVISRQYEWGLRKSTDDSMLSLAFFKMIRPSIEDSAPDFKTDGQQLYTGLEIEVERIWGELTTNLSGLILDTKKERAELNSINNGKALVNVPQYKLKMDLDYKLKSTPGFSLNSSLQFSGERFVTNNNTLKIPGWMTTNIGCSYEWSGQQSLQFQIENLTDNKYWKESPTQFGHIYLFPGESRKLTLNYKKTIK